MVTLGKQNHFSISTYYDPSLYELRRFLVWLLEFDDQATGQEG